jgi:hypothetical protein
MVDSGESQLVLFNMKLVRRWTSYSLVKTDLSATFTDVLL